MGKLALGSCIRLAKSYLTFWLWFRLLLAVKNNSEYHYLFPFGVLPDERRIWILCLLASRKLWCWLRNLRILFVFSHILSRFSIVLYHIPSTPTLFLVVVVFNVITAYLFKSSINATANIFHFFFLLIFFGGSLFNGNIINY